MINSNGFSSKKKTVKSTVTVLNYMTPLLYKRLDSIIDMSFYKTSNSLETLALEVKNGPSSNSDTERIALIDLFVEDVPESRKVKIQNYNWMDDYKIKPQLERIVWKSKLYSKEKFVLKDQSLVERTENQVDIALRKFCCWFNNVFDDKHSHITDDYIKKLFSSGFEIHPAAQSIYIEPKPIFSIPHQIAEKYNVPELSTKNQQKKLMNLDEIVSPVKRITESNVAFGKCLPVSNQSRHEIEECMKANFPDELRTEQYLFKGIEDLRSTKTLVKHVNNSDTIEIKPLYFKNFIYEDDEKYVPLYKKLGNKM